MIDDPTTLPAAPIVASFVAPRAGFVERYDAGLLGRAAVQLGAGRARAADPVDPAVGFELVAVPGDHVVEGAPLIAIHARSAADVELIRPMVAEALTLADTPPAPRTLIIERLGLARSN
jgi:thymidine phosphorylase